MTNYKNNLPPYAEEIIINQEINQIQEILRQFKQLVPVDFVKLEAKGRNYMCSTEGWKEPICERYIFFDNNKPIQLDIPQKIMIELGLKENEDVHYPVYVLPEVLKRTPIQLGITIKDKKEVFIQKPLTKKNFERELNKWLTELKSSREKISQLTITEKLSQESAQENQLLKTELKGEKQLGQSQKIVYQQRIQYLKDQLNQIQNELDALPTLNDYQLLQTERDNAQTRLGITDLNNLPVLLQGETLASLLARPTQVQYQNLNGQLITANASITQRDIQIANLTQQVNAWNNCFPSANGNPNLVRAEIDKLNNELQNEKDWWDKWINDNTRELLPSWGNSSKLIFPDRTKWQYKNGSESVKDFKINIKRFYQYYRDK